MKPGLAETCYVFFKTMANPTRLAILETLRDGSKNVTEIAEKLKQEQSMISHNLKPLLECNFVYIKREGKKRIYSVNEETVGALFRAVENHAEKFCPTGGKCHLK